MKHRIITLLIFFIASFTSAEVLVLIKGESLPANAQPNGLAGIRERLDQIEGVGSWLNTNKGDINREYIAWRDKTNRFTIVWDLEDGKIVHVYFYQGAPKWERGKMTPMKWPKNGTITINLESGMTGKAKPARAAP